MSSFSDDGWGFEDEAQVKASMPKPSEQPMTAPTLVDERISRTIELEKPVSKTAETPILKQAMSTEKNMMSIPHVVPAEQVTTYEECSDDGWGTPEKKEELDFPADPQRGASSSLKLPPTPTAKLDPSIIPDDTITLDIDDTLDVPPEKPVKHDIMPPRVNRTASSSHKGSDFGRSIPIIAAEPPLIKSFGGTRPADDGLPPRSFGFSQRSDRDDPPPPSFGRQENRVKEAKVIKPAVDNLAGMEKSFGFGSQQKSTGLTGERFGSSIKPLAPGNHNSGFIQPSGGIGADETSQRTIGFGGPRSNVPSQTTNFGESQAYKKPVGFGRQSSETPDLAAPKFGSRAPKSDHSVGFGEQRSVPSNPPHNGFARNSGSGYAQSSLENHSKFAAGFEAPSKAGSKASTVPCGFAGGFEPPTKSGFSEAEAKPSAGFGGGSARSAEFGGGSAPSAGFGGGSARLAGFGGGSKPSAGFGGESARSAGFGERSKPAAGIGEESARSAGFGERSKPAAGFGEESARSAGFGGGFASSAGFGERSAPSAGFREKSVPSAGFREKSVPSAGFGGGSKPTAGFGIGSKQSAGFGIGSKPSLGFGSSGTSTNNGFGDNANLSGGFGSSGNSGFEKSDFGEPRKASFGYGSSGFGGNSGRGMFGDGDDGFGGEITSVKRDRGSGCFNCGQEGHRSNDCPEPRKAKVCRNCGLEGHFKTECQEPQKPRDPCRNCGQEGHWAKECQNERVRTEPTEPCRRCGEEGHWGSECPSRPTDLQGNPLVPYDVVFTPEDEIFNNAVDNDSRMDFDQKVVASMGDVIIPDMTSFDGFKVLATEISDNLKRMKMNRPTAIQRAAFFPILNGTDVVACAHTGCGKTLAFLIPLVTKLLEDMAESSDVRDDRPSPLLLIVAPTRELANQTFNTARQLTYQTGLKCGLAYGGYSRTSNLQHLRSFDKLSILVATMGRLQDFIASGEITLSKMKYVVLDEADRMVDSNDFGEEVNKILGPPDERASQTLLFSASFSENLQREDLPKFVKKGYTMLQVDKFGTANEKIDQQIRLVNRTDKKTEFYKLIGVDENSCTILPKAPIESEKTLVFVNTVKYSDTLAAELAHAGVNAIAMHSHQNQENRDRILDDFRRGKWQCMVASNVCARGLNIAGLDHVINYDMPDKNGFDEYVNRIGRTGRAGYTGKSTAFIDDQSDKEIVPDLIKILTEAKKEVPEWLADLQIFEEPYQEEDEEQW